MLKCPCGPRCRDRLLATTSRDPSASQKIWKPKLAFSELHIWRIAFNVAHAAIATLSETLSPDEQARAAQFLRTQDQESFTITRAVLRDILGRYTGSLPRDCRFASNAYGKPVMVYPDPRGMEFNVSHTDGLAFVAISRGQGVGIDVERVVRKSDFLCMSQHIFSSDELSVINCLTSADRPEAFFNLWTHKEAYLKCLGVGIGGAVSLCSVPTAPVCCAFSPEGRWMSRLAAGSGYAAHVVLDGKCVGINYFDWTTSRDINV